MICGKHQMIVDQRVAVHSAVQSESLRVEKRLDPVSLFWDVNTIYSERASNILHTKLFSSSIHKWLPSLGRKRFVIARNKNKNIAV